MPKKSKIKEATLEDKRALSSVANNKADIVIVRNKRFSIGWTHPATGDWISELIIKDGGDRKVIAQSAALIVLATFWKSHLLYWLVWRWFYYVKQYTYEELMPIVECAQKKTAQEEAPAYLRCMILLQGLSTLHKQMTKEEAERILHAQATGSVGNLPKNTGISTEPLKILGIPVSGMLYYVRWKLTQAQIDLIAADVSVIDYDYGKDKKRKKGEFDDTPADKESIRKTNEEYLARHADGVKPVSITDILGNNIKEIGVKPI